MRAFSILEYIILKRKKSYITSIRELFRHEDVNVHGISNLDYWLRLWGIQQEPDQQNNLLISKRDK